MEMSSGNLSDEACNTKAACQCSSNDTDSLSYPKRKAGNDKHHTCSETSNVLSACSVSVNSSPPEGSDEVEEGCNCSNKPKKLLAKESLQEIGPLSDKSEPSSITSLRDVYVGASSLKGDISESSMDQAESSYRRLGKNDVLDSAESAKLISGGDLASTSAKCADQNQDFVSMVVPNVYQPPVRSRPAGCHDGSDLLVDVKVCDICGDAGREDLLAICSKCADGAEHIYCMRIKLDKVPDRNWMCEECTSFEEIEKRMQNKIEPAIGSLKRSNEICRNAGNSSTTANIKTCLDLDIEGSNVKKIRRDNVSSLSQFSVKRNAGDLDYALVNKRKVVQTSVESPRVLSNHHSFDGNRANVRSPTILHHNSPKFRSRLPISRGTLSKSKSFSCSGSKREVQSREEPPKKRSCGETSSIDKKTDNAIRKISKSVSFDNVSSGCQNVGQSKVKIISPSNSRVEDLKSLKSAKVSSSIQKVSSSIQNKNTFKSDKPRVSLPTTGSCPSPSENGKRVSYSGRTMEVNSSANKNSNSKLSRHSINSSKSSRHVVHEDSKCIEDPAVTGGIKRLHSCLTDVAQNPSSPIMPDSSHRLKGTLRSNSFPTNSRHCGNTGATVQVKFSQSRESSDQVDKAHEGSSFGTASEQIKVGSPQGCKYKDTVAAGESCQIISPRTKVHEGEKGEDVDQCGPIEDPAVTGGIKGLLSCLSDVTQNPSSPIIPDSSHRLKGTLRSNSFPTNSRHCDSTGATAQVKFSQSRESSDRVDKAHEGSNFGTASEQIKVGSPQGCKYKDTVTAGESCQIISPWTKVHEGEKGEDVDQCGPIEDPAVTGGIKRLFSCLSDVTRNPSSPIIPDSSHQLKGTLRSNSFPTNSRHCGSTGATAQVKFSQSRESSDRVDKAHEGSNFGTTSEQIKVGSPQGCKYKDTVTAGESCQIISPRTKVHEGEKGEDVDQCGPIEDPAVTGGIKRLLSCLSDVTRNPSSPIIPDSSHQLKGTLRSNSFPTNSRHCGSTGATAQVKFSQSRESSNRVDKAHEGSNFGTASEQIKVGSPQGCKNKDTVTAGESCQIISPRTKVHEGEKGEDVDQCGPIDLGRNILLQPDVSRNFAVPSLDFIWKGGFKMARCARLSSFIRGIQAHVSTRASLKVAEVVKKFPCNILLEEVSCSKTWPTQFRQTKPSEDNIALYFFAEDFESYMRNYKSMVDCMMCYDLALKGNIDELELLIFPSNLLPPTSQRWNNLFFLWGIFRGKKVDNIPCLPSCQNNTSTPNLNYAIPDKNNYIPTGPGFENKHSSGPASECISAASNLYRNVHHSSNFISPPDLPYVSSERNGENHKPELPNPEPELPCPEQKCFGLQTNFDSKARDDTISFSSIPTRKEQLPTDVQDINNFLKEQVLAETKKDEIQCLDLNVALETGRTSAKKEKSINLLGTTISIGGGDGDDDENSVSLDLSLGL